MMLPDSMALSLLVVIGLIFLDTVLGALDALFKGEFSFQKLGQFVRSSVAPYVVGLLALAVLAVLPTGQQQALAAAYYAAVAASVAKFIADILAKIKSFGVPVEK